MLGSSAHSQYLSVILFSRLSHPEGKSLRTLGALVSCLVSRPAKPAPGGWTLPSGGLRSPGLAGAGRGTTATWDRPVLSISSPQVLASGLRAVLKLPRAGARLG